MCGTKVFATAEVTVVHRLGPVFQYILLVQEDKRYHLAGDNPEPQLVAEALAACSQTDQIREAVGLPLLDSQTFPAITMVGSAASFYKITITRELALAVQAGMYPENATVVLKFVPPVPDPLSYPSQGMVPLGNRRILLK